MKRITTFLLLAFAVVSLKAAGHTHTTPVAAALMPQPQSVTTEEGLLHLTGIPSIKIIGSNSDRLIAAGQRFTERFSRQTGLTRSIPNTLLTLRIRNSALPLLDKKSESYTLAITPQGITLNAATELGALRGLQTLLQWVGINQGPSLALPSAVIRDQPRFAWRGLLLDSVRHFLPVTDIKRQLDGMAAAKLNVLHWHLTDDQGWRFESSAYPRLHTVASNNGQFYSRQQITDVVNYAHARGIYVLPEIDMPGHASAIALAYPELMSAPGPYRAEDRWGVHKPLLNPANPKVYQFAQTILQEVAELFPFPYVHIGGDEVDPEHWQNNPNIQAFARANNLPDSHALHAYFNRQLSDILSQLNRAMIGWDEVLHPELAPGTIVQSWQGPDALGRAINMGFPALLSTGFYLDQPQYANYHHRVRFLPQPIDIDTTPADNESWSSWRFMVPRKRGSDVQGQLTVIGEEENARGFIDFQGKSRQVVQNLRRQDGDIQFNVDTWMGPVAATLTTTQNQLYGTLQVGNAPYTLTGERVAGSDIAHSRIPVPQPKDYIDSDKQHLLLGGEAALWSEMVDRTNLDLRLWPRGFVVAERLWSDASVREEKSMQQRLRAVANWSVHSVGLLHDEQQKNKLATLAPKAELSTLLTVSSALEPAHYYHRHHEKSVHETYSRRDRLNRLADALPAQSDTAIEFAQQVNAWLTATNDKAQTAALQTQLRAWKKASEALSKTSANNELQALNASVYDISCAGLTLIKHIQARQTLEPDQLTDIRNHLNTALRLQHEIIVAAAFGVERLFLHSQTMPPQGQ
ncbi:beta-N-acetylhexosaminidase [Gilvimarinus sp. 1_MG-2023]|uniref:beta-N-acetylhexosaminidase n=1 Tax=Gilvimarinus sp. 1_MG-2023 TaxID=3062638 RepID=UPI0026E38431|nr:family 20 glycosylhydrolase [Gilvimarinus sp. 1_MG-2023]MDO6748033.1 family 20 glycosylhydrolase [Gilvimarinus sp. 1_MG-2023]